MMMLIFYYASGSLTFLIDGHSLSLKRVLKPIVLKIQAIILNYKYTKYKNLPDLKSA